VLEEERQDSFYGEVYLLPFQIESITLCNVGPFEKFETHFSRDEVNIIFGSGGSGKSTIIRSILLAFGRRHKYFTIRSTEGGRIKLKLFPTDTSINLEYDIERKNITKGYQCLIADDPLMRIPRNMIAPLVNELSSLRVQIIITVSVLMDQNVFPANSHIISNNNKWSSGVPLTPNIGISSS